MCPSARMTPLKAANQLRARFSDSLSMPRAFRGEITLFLNDPGRIAEVCAFAKETLYFNYLIDISSVDHYREDNESEVGK